MELQTITEDPHVARRAFLQYRNAIRGPAKEDLNEAYRELREIDEEMLRAYRELAKGVTLLRLSETLTAGGTESRWRHEWATCLPRLAIARATARHVWTSGVDQRGGVRFSWELTESTQQLSWSKRNSVRLSGVFAEEKDWKLRSGTQHRATVPVVPPQFRPAVGLGGYHVLFEAEWSAPPVPADPALLKHIGGDLWAVLATWDLTPLEAAVLGQRR